MSRKPHKSLCVLYIQTLDFEFIDGGINGGWRVESLLRSEGLGFKSDWARQVTENSQGLLFLLSWMDGRWKMLQGLECCGSAGCTWNRAGVWWPWIGRFNQIPGGLVEWSGCSTMDHGRLWWPLDWTKDRCMFVRVHVYLAEQMVEIKWKKRKLMLTQFFLYLSTRSQCTRVDD